MHLRQPGFTYSDSGSFMKNKGRIQKFKETGDSRYIYQNQLDITCFQHDIDYGDFKDLTRRTASDKILRDNVFNIAKNPKCKGYQHGFASVFYFLTIRSEALATKSMRATRDKSASGGANKNENMSNKELAEE